jgi:hypothetical protein
MVRLNNQPPTGLIGTLRGPLEEGAKNATVNPSWPHYAALSDSP